MTNLFALVPAVGVAIDTVDFAAAGINFSNMAIIYQVGDPLRSFVPGRSINPITGFEAGQGYYIISKADLDLEDFILTGITEPLPVGGEFADNDGSAFIDSDNLLFS